MRRVLFLTVVVFLFALAASKDVAAQNGPPPVDRFVEMQTSEGPIIIKVAYSLIPYTAGNFLDLVNKGFYNGLTFHRVESWVVQGGDPQGNGTGNYIDPQTGRPRFLKLETHPRLTHNYPGMVAMARSSNPNSASCQFYILKRAMPQLNGNYAVFGKVVRGMDVVQRMRIGDRIISARILPLQDENQPSQEAQQAPPQQQEPERRGPITYPSPESGF